MVENISGMSRMTVSRAVSLLSAAYISLIKSSLPFRTFPSVMMWGAPGVGKSQGVRQVAKKIEENTDKKVVVTDVRLLLFNPVDLRGIPTSNEDKTLAVWLKPKIFQMDESDEIVNILFLDEISAAPPSVQAAAYQITLDRVVGEHKLPENCIVIAAGNRVTDKSVAFTMPRALANRLCHIEIESSAESWHNWAVANGINQMVTGFLSASPLSLNETEFENNELAFPSPRSWEMVSNILNSVCGDLNKVYPLVEGCIGTRTAGSFRAWCEIFNKLPPIEDAFCDDFGSCSLPVRPEAMLAFVSKMVAYASGERTEKEIRNSIEYAAKLPNEIKYKLFDDYLRIKSIQPALKKSRSYAEWMIYNDKDWLYD